MIESDFAIFEAIGALVVVLDTDGRIVYWNGACSRLTGYSIEEVRGREIWGLLLVPAEVEQVREILAKLTTEELPSQHANYWVTKTGEQRWIAWSHTFTTNPDGGIQYIIKTGIDRTERKRASDALRASEAKLVALAAENARIYDDALHATDDLREANQHMVSATILAQEMTERAQDALKRAEDSERELRAVAEFREKFIGILGHDLRNPLAAIGISAETLLRSGHLDAQDQRIAARIGSSSQRMTRMISQLLDLTRTRLGGGFPLDPKRSDLRDVCRTVAEEFEATVHVEVQGDVTGRWDPDRLTEALSNIVGNAVEHAAPGTAVAVRVFSEGAEVVVEIENRGDPIPADLLPFIFAPFRRGKLGRSARGNLGLGLYIAKQIVLASGGTLDAGCAGGKTTFVMRLPRHSAPASHASRRAEARE